MASVWARLSESLTLKLEKNDRISYVLLIPALLLVVWSLLLFVSPLTQAPGTIYLGNEGKVNVADNADYINSHITNPVARGVYLIGDIMCHQHADRSYFIGGNQMPFCARCTGIFLGLTIGMVIGTIFRVKVGVGLYILTLLPMVLDGSIQLITPYESTNIVRFLTGLLVGVFTSLVLCYIYYDAHGSPSHR
jgi:uncharacterized membrane protein